MSSPRRVKNGGGGVKGEQGPIWNEIPPFDTLHPWRNGRNRTKSELHCPFPAALDRMFRELLEMKQCAGFRASRDGLEERLGRESGSGRPVESLVHIMGGGRNATRPALGRLAGAKIILEDSAREGKTLRKEPGIRIRFVEWPNLKGDW